ERSFAAAEANCVRDLAAGDDELFTQLVFTRDRAGRIDPSTSRLVTDQIADVGNDPFLASFDEPIFIKLRNVGFNVIGLLRHDLQKSAQLPFVVRIAQPIDRGEKLEEAIQRRRAHGFNSDKRRQSGTMELRYAICAGKMPVAPARAGLATIRDGNLAGSAD